jgi:diadenosine tetraphosphate (Ap4A) HIT family hydrolase
MNLHYTLDDARSVGQAPWDNVVQEDFHVVIFKDKYPVTEGHLLFVPQYAADGVIEDCFADALKIGKQKVESGEWDGFNIGLNWGEAAGQTVMYPHIHLIPRRKGDVEDPIGGVRNTIPGKGNYRKYSVQKEK